MIDVLAIALVLHLYCSQRQTFIQRSGKTPTTRLSNIEDLATIGLGSTDVHTISHETIRAADLVPRRHELLR